MSSPSTWSSATYVILIKTVAFGGRFPTLTVNTSCGNGKPKQFTESKFHEKDAFLHKHFNSDVCPNLCGPHRSFLVLVHQIGTVSLAYGFLVLFVCRLFLFHFTHDVLVVDKRLKPAHDSHVVQRKNIFCFNGLIAVVCVGLQNYDLKEYRSRW